MNTCTGTHNLLNFQLVALHPPCGFRWLVGVRWCDPYGVRCLLRRCVLGGAPPGVVRRSVGVGRRRSPRRGMPFLGVGRVVPCPCFFLPPAPHTSSRIIPKRGCGLGFALIRGLSMGLGIGFGGGFGRGLRSAIHLHGGGLRGSFGPGLRGLFSLRVGVRLCGLGRRLSRRVSVGFGVRLRFGLGGLVRCSCSVLLLPTGRC